MIFCGSIKIYNELLSSFPNVISDRLSKYSILYEEIKVTSVSLSL